MEISITPSKRNEYPLIGVLIRSGSIAVWLRELQQLGISLSEITAYPVPSQQPNELWGCIFFRNDFSRIETIGRNEYCQLVNGHLFIPEYSKLLPALHTEDLNKLFPEHRCFMHPEVGLVELAEEIDWVELIARPELLARRFQQPKPSPFIPKVLRSIRLQPMASATAVEEMLETSVGEQKDLTEERLSLWEKIKLGFLKLIFSDKNGNGLTSVGSLIEKLGGAAFKDGKFKDGQLAQDYNDLEERNRRVVDRLMDMLKRDPAEALRYAPPLDSSGSGRGSSQPGALGLNQIWGSFNLFGSSSSGRSGGSISHDAYMALQNGYRETARKLIAQKEYEKAAFVYMKLLKDYRSAAETLAEGKFYNEAATIYFVHLNLKEKAAECYEKGMVTDKAIELYAELNNFEKVGDLYLSIGKQNEAFYNYEKVVASYTKNMQFIKASLLCKNKMGKVEEAQELLLQGWRLNSDTLNCISCYFANIEDEEAREQAIKMIYREEVKDHNRTVFLTSIKHQYKKSPQTDETIRDIAYEIIAEEAIRNPEITSDLRLFNEEDKLILKDTMRYKTNRKNYWYKKK